MNNKISKDMAARFFKLSIHLGCLFSNLPLEHDKIGCLIINKDNYSILASGITTIVYDENINVENTGKKTPLYILHAEEDTITKASKLGTGLEDCIMIISHFPCCHCLKLIIQSGINTIITILSKCCQENIEIYRKFESSIEFILLDIL
jgi:deoxycytidylate deaminase